MRLTKSMLFYFGFWILYLPMSIVLTLLLNYTLEQFFVSLGLGALILLVCHVIGLVVHIISSKRKVMASPPSNSETPSPKDDMNGFRMMFNENIGGTE